MTVKMKKSLILLSGVFLSASALAVPAQLGSYTYLGGGLQFGEQKNDSLASFLGKRFEGKGPRDLLGFNIKGSYSPDSLSAYVKVESEWSSSGNTDISNSFGGVGGYYNFTHASVFYTLGTNRYSLEREHHSGNGSDEFDKTGIAGDIGVRLPVLPFYVVTPRYRVSSLDGHVMNDYKLYNEFALGNRVSLELNVDYNTYWDAEEFNTQTAIKFSF